MAHKFQHDYPIPLLLLVRLCEHCLLLESVIKTKLEAFKALQALHPTADNEHLIRMTLVIPPIRGIVPSLVDTPGMFRALFTSLLLFSLTSPPLGSPGPGIACLFGEEASSSDVPPPAEEKASASTTTVEEVKPAPLPELSTLPRLPDFDDSDVVSSCFSYCHPSKHSFPHSLTAFNSEWSVTSPVH